MCLSDTDIGDSPLPSLVAGVGLPVSGGASHGPYDSAGGQWRWRYMGPASATESKSMGL